MVSNNWRLRKVHRQWDIFAHIHASPQLGPSTSPLGYARILCGMQWTTTRAVWLKFDIALGRGATRLLHILYDVYFYFRLFLRKNVDNLLLSIGIHRIARNHAGYENIKFNFWNLFFYGIIQATYAQKKKVTKHTVWIQSLHCTGIFTLILIRFNPAFSERCYDFWMWGRTICSLHRVMLCSPLRLGKSLIRANRLIWIYNWVDGNVYLVIMECVNQN